ncbi:hypothetical protein BFJ68_g17148 [Fusarium oxysporum]|uniref:Uncharacterized protein n=1 Tax=Fusarium oxysporum TaxID=5507 RepID=A0A420P1U2_FUSOX|nr:hypothetical protein BFJ68_g17148 [Fusarium oxysporum]
MGRAETADDAMVDVAHSRHQQLNTERQNELEDG